MWDWVQEILKQNGLAGACIFVSGAVNFALWRQISIIQEKRVAEARDTVRAIEASTRAVENQGETIDAFVDTIRVLLAPPQRRGRGP